MKQFNILKLFMPLLLALGSYQSAWALAGGTYTIGAGGNYSNLAAAVSDLNLGITGPVVFNVLPGTYSGTGWQGLIGNVTGASSTNTITFQAQNGPGTASISFAGTSTANYVFGLNSARYVTIRNLTLANTNTSYGNVVRMMGTASFNTIAGCRLVGPSVSSSSADLAVVWAGQSGNVFTGSDITCQNDTFQNGSAAYWSYGSASTNLTMNHTITNCQINNPYYSLLYCYYTGNINVSGCSFTANSSGLNYGFYFYYPGNGVSFTNNTANITTTYSGHYTFYWYNVNYTSGVQGTTTNAYNTINVNSTSNTVYGMYHYYNYNMTMQNNTYNFNGTSGTIYAPYYMAYYWNAGSVAKNNTINVTVTTGTAYVNGVCAGASGTAVRNNTFNATATGSGAAHAGYYLNAYGTSDTVENNTFNATTTSGSCYSYKYGETGLTRNNTFNLNSTSGTIYNYFYYMNAANFRNNTIKMNSTTGTIYGCYDYNYYSSNTAVSTIAYNTFDARSSSGGTVYAYYNAGTPVAGAEYVSNLFTTNTSGTSYLLYPTANPGADMKFIHNTFHSNSTGTVNYLVYTPAGSSTYPGKYILTNNIFSRINNNGTAVYRGDTTYNRADYNLYYSGGGVQTFQCGSPAITTTSLQTWRTSTRGFDMNSLTYDPGFVSPATYDFRPSAGNANAWSVNGRGTHLANDTMDIAGNARARTKLQGVPDLGAYEFTPTSTPPDAIATPATPAANTAQTFTFGQDTVCVINWGATVPATATVKQYTGVQATGIPAGVGKMFFYNDVATTLGVYSYKAVPYYKDPWIGDISTEPNARIAKSSNGASWAGYNYTNGITDINRNTMTTAAFLDSMPSRFTGVENARIGIRCVIAPTGLKSNGVTAFTATETWDAVFSPIGYQYVYKNVKGTPVTGTPAYFVSSNSAPLTGLTEDTTYYIYVRTICGPGDTSGWALDSFHTIISCHAPDLKLSYMDSKQAVIYWAPIKTAVGYDWAVTTDANPPANGTPTASTSLLAAYLAPGTTYYAHVRSRCSTIYSQSGWSTISFKTWTTGVDNVSGSAIGLIAYPNPVKEVLTVNMQGVRANNAQLTIIDITGKIVRSMAVVSDKNEINMNGLSSGVYILKYSDDAHTEMTKITKE